MPSAKHSALQASDLRMRRRRLGFTQAELAQWLAVSANTVARWERGELHIGDPRRVDRVLAGLERRLLAHTALATNGDRAVESTRRAPVGTQLHTWRPTHHSLPPELSSFVGRELELTRLVERLGSVRLVSLVGPGGVGKTRLALQAANLVLQNYADGVWFVELAPLADSDMVANAVAATLGVQERGRLPLSRVLADTLRERQLLLILDNCEHVLDGCATLVHTLLRDCRQLTILATSREPLRVVGELRQQVPPLSVAPGTGEDFEACEAVRLFIERACEVKPDFQQSRDTHRTVASICTHLDGLPLAIELAAAQTESIPLRPLLQQLESSRGSLPVLVDGPRDAPARQQTLRATIAWSYDLLSADERALFRRLAPFHGCSTEAVEAVCIPGSSGPGQASVTIPPLSLTARTGLASLVSRNLLQVEDDGQGEPWYSMLETVREFALDRLEASPEAAAVWRRYTWYYLRLVEQTEQPLRALRQEAFLDRLEREHANVRSAMDWCQGHGYAEASLRLAVGLFWFWTVRGYTTEGRRRLEGMLARFPLRSITGTRARVHAEALDAVGHIAAAQSDLEPGAEFELQALDIFERLNDTDGTLAALDALAVIARKQNDLAAATAYVERILQTLHNPNGTEADPPTRALALANLGALAHERGDAHEAAAYLEEAARMIEAVDNSFGTGLVKLNVAGLAHETGDFERARALAESALQLLEREHDQRGVALALAHLGSMATGRRDFAGAFAHLSRSLQLNTEMADPHGVAFVLDRFAVLASASGQPERALRLAGAAKSFREQAGILPNAVEQDYIDHQLELARDMLGRMAHAVFAAGASLRLGEATTEALAIGSVHTRSGAPDDGDRLSDRERQVAVLVGYGYTNRRIAASLIISEATAATHVRNVLNKLQLTSRAQIAVWANHQGLLEQSASNGGLEDAPLSG